MSTARLVTVVGSPWTEFLTHTHENLTFPQLLLRVKISRIDQCSGMLAPFWIMIWEKALEASWVRNKIKKPFFKTCVCLSVFGVQMWPLPIGPYCTAPRHRVPEHGSLLTSSGHHWRPVQTCSLQDPPQGWHLGLLKHVRSAEAGGTHPIGMFSCYLPVSARANIDM